jgi:hypothetical protein
VKATQAAGRTHEQTGFLLLDGRPLSDRGAAADERLSASRLSEGRRRRRVWAAARSALSRAPQLDRSWLMEREGRVKDGLTVRLGRLSARGQPLRRLDERRDDLSKKRRAA